MVRIVPNVDGDMLPRIWHVYVLMITNIRLELSDEERNDLAKRIDRNPDTKRLVTRKEVTDLVESLIQYEIERGYEDDQSTEAGTGAEAPVDGNPGQRGDGGGDQRVPDDVTPDFVPSRGDEDYLAQPRDPGVAAACSRILDDAALIEKFAWDTVERNRKK